MAYGGGLENRCRRKMTVGSNPTPSARVSHHQWIRQDARAPLPDTEYKPPFSSLSFQSCGMASTPRYAPDIAPVIAVDELTEAGLSCRSQIQTPDFKNVRL